MMHHQHCTSIVPRMFQYLKNIFFNALSQRYKFIGRLNGHLDAINCLSITSNGALLASGGECREIFVHSMTHQRRFAGSDGTRVWDLVSRKELWGPLRPHLERGQISCLAWVTGTGDPSETLCFGTSLGYLVFWRQSGEKVSREPTNK